MKRALRLGLVGLLCGLIGWLAAETIERAKPPLANIRVSAQALPRDTKLGSYAPVARAVGPSVVNVFSTKTVKSPNADLRTFSHDPLLRRFFGHDKAPATRKELSLGSGVIVSEDGYILTNNHVVDGAEEILVSLPNGEERDFLAQVIGRDNLTDLAVLKIPAQQLPVVTFGKSDQLQVGDVVLAVGNPFGLGQTVTMGIISGLKREGLGLEGQEDFIQTDAAINPGNSGGALVDLAGRLVGINTAILSGSGGNQGVGFAIPSELALGIMEQLIHSGKVVRGYLGVGVQSLTPSLAKALKISPATSGALVSEVPPRSPAARAGLKPGDVIVGFAGHAIPDSRSLRQLVAKTPPRSQVNVQILRGNQRQTFKVTLQVLPTTEPTLASLPPAPVQKPGLSGLSLKDLDRLLRQHLGVPDHVQGAVVCEVDPDSAAYEAGLRPGDVIQEIEHQPVSNATQATQAVRRASQKQALVLVWNQEGAHFLAVGKD